jgi:uncharacterized protein (TIGR02271 family)
MLTREHIDRLLSEGANVFSADGEKIGSIGQIYVDNDGGEPSWVTVRTGLFGMSESFVPLEGARAEGNQLVVPYSKDQVKEAPRIDAGRALEPAEEDRLYQHYQLEGARTNTDATAIAADSSSREGIDRAQAPAAAGTGREAGAPAGSDAHAQAPGTDQAQAPSAAGTGREAGAPTGSDAHAQAPGTDQAQAPSAAGTGREDGAPTGSAARAAQAPGTDQAQAPSAAGTGREYGAPAGSAARAAQAPGTDQAQAPSAAGTGREDGAPAGSAARAQAPGTDQAQAPSAAGTGREAGAPTAEQSQAAAQSRPDSGGQQPATGRGRLRKYVTSENVTRTVPVQHEEVRIKREPIAEEDRAEALQRPDSDDEREVILHEERVIVTKEKVPVERVRIETETVTEEVTINEEVHKEHLDADGTEEGRG